MGSIANIPAQSQSLVFGIRDCSSSIVDFVSQLWRKIRGNHQSTQSIIYVQDTDITPDLFQLEREGPVYQFDSVLQETMKLLTLIGNAIVDVHLFISLITSSYCSLTSYDWPLAGSPISTDLEISNKSLSLTAKLYASS